ncbi:MAG: SMP-30/gluconolactonase/LRE family protein [Rhodovarius sp.]|nr:SMP-30/gluconolactonase/LRE family protein [Rhodovarius sp.]
MSSWQPSLAYPDPAIRILDPAFRGCIPALAAVERLFHGTRWGEGPVWFGDQRCLLWSDIPNDRILRWEEETGAVSVFRRGGHANGNTRDREGRLITCEHSGRRVVRTEYDGRLTVLADSFAGKPLNAPNDVVVAPDGGIWFTDPAFAPESPYLGRHGPCQLPGSVYRIDPTTGRIACMADHLPGPNGLAFTPDGATLIVVASRAEPREFLAFPVLEGRLGPPRCLIRCAPGETPDGFRIDTAGRLWCGWGMGGEGRDGVRIFDPQGQPIGHIALPERCANLCFGGRHRNRLFMACGQSLYALYTDVQGCPFPTG